MIVGKNPTCLSPASVCLMTAAAIFASLRGLLLLAKEEMAMFAYLAFAVVFYLVPASLVSAKLGGAFSGRKGGIYTWVGEAFGRRWGFLAVWLQWLQNMVLFLVGLTFGTAVLAYTIGRPDVAKNGVFIGGFCIVPFLGGDSSRAAWRAGLRKGRQRNVYRRNGRPGLLLLILLGYWLSTGRPIGWVYLSDLAVSGEGRASFWPTIHEFGGVAFLAGIVLLFTGVEVQAVRVVEMRRPGRGYPLAIGIGALASLLIFALGAISIAEILPHERISLQSLAR